MPRSSFPRQSVSETPEPIRIRGARVHNLQNVSCDLPVRALTVVTGVSGSGKSSLAFDTLYAEGQRRYVESLSAYARQFLERLEKPDVDSIEGLFPAIAIEQRNTVRGKRSTVGTATELSDYFRLLFARFGKTHCPDCGREVRAHGTSEVLGEVAKMKEGTRLFVAYPLPLAEDAKLTTKELARQLVQEGYMRIIDSGRVVELEAWEERDLDAADELSVVVDRVAVKHTSAFRKRLGDSLDLALRAGEGTLLLRDTKGKVRVFSDRFSCDDCDREFQKPEPGLFSFNHPQGACPDCKGFGYVLGLDEGKIVPDVSKSLRGGAVAPWEKVSRRRHFRRMLLFCEDRGISTDTPYEKLSDSDKKLLWKGGKGYAGIEGFFDRLQRKSYKMHVRVYLSRYRGSRLCAQCGGSRLRAEACYVRLGKKSFPEVMAWDIQSAGDYISKLKFSDAFEKKAAQPLVAECRARLDYLQRVGLGYLTLDRSVASLSGGESQRISLASLLGSALTGTMLILDEPTVGLHPRDTDRLVSILKSLRDLGNTLVVVEHERAVMDAADHLLELGPRAGHEGGHLVAEGSASHFRKSSALTAQYLRGDKCVPRMPGKSIEALNDYDSLNFKNAHLHNLKHLNFRFPLGGLVVVTGVSGSGKSTLIRDLLYKAWEHEQGRGPMPEGLDAIEGFDCIDDIVLVDQSPLGRSVRSNALTLTGAFAEVRALFAQTPEAKKRRMEAGAFSFNSQAGRCPDCEGLGWTEVEMQFLADVRLVCETCRGQRYKKNVLRVPYRGYSIADVLNSTVREGMALYSDRKKIVDKLRPLHDVGLGYLKLGQPTATLSGGEAQRMKLASFIASTRRARTLYLFDEPTTGLHFEDVVKLIKAFRHLIERGHSVCVVEHHLDVIKNADYLIDLGPDGGDAGGRIVATGRPEDLADTPESHTGRYLREGALL